MILNATLCDYLRLGSFNPADYADFLNVFRNMTNEDDSKDGTFLQYKGKRYAHGFVGSAMQNRRPHYLLEFSGTAAAIAYYTLASISMADVTCSRIDVQITIPLPDDYESTALFERLRGNVPYGRSVTLYRSDEGLDTVYIGRRTTKNGRVTRIYVKEYVAGYGLRFETEFKGGHARQHWSYLYEQRGELEHLLTLEIESLGRLDFKPLSDFYDLLKGNIPAPRPTRVETSNPTLEWLLKTCDPVIRRMLNDHDHGSKVRHWLETLLDWS